MLKRRMLNVAEQLAEMHIIDDNAIDVEMANAAEEEQNQEERVLKTVCHRDIAAARCISYKGRFELFMGYTPDIFRRNAGIEIHFDVFNTYAVEAEPNAAAS
ncbi:uncharacterized protein LOC116338924 [Contarinia nasturtii]|uniref:uncharacterized protein LOC116338924 n=1 Tax=Contarinia nasturtii TaxID=265458 RepID=UPI0012D456B7|nr:uncharacterized protein LOC116338924 [Contarinia nasturtii]